MGTCSEACEEEMKERSLYPVGVSSSGTSLIILQTDPDSHHAGTLSVPAPCPLYRDVLVFGPDHNHSPNNSNKVRHLLYRTSHQFEKHYKKSTRYFNFWHMNHESAFKYQIRPILKDSKHTPQHHQSTTKTQTTERVDPCWVWVSFLFPASLTDCRLLTDEGTKKKRCKCFSGVQVFLCGQTLRLKPPGNTVFTHRHLM